MMMENQQEFYNMTANKMAGPTLKWILSCACTWLKWPVRGIASNVKLTSSPVAAYQLWLLWRRSVSSVRKCARAALPRESNGRSCISKRAADAWLDFRVFLRDNADGLFLLDLFVHACSRTRYAAVIRLLCNQSMFISAPNISQSFRTFSAKNLIIRAHRLSSNQIRPNASQMYEEYVNTCWI